VKFAPIAGWSQNAAMKAPPKKARESGRGDEDTWKIEE
jgi:hypothetical protein